MTREEWRDRAVEHGVEIAKLKKKLAIAIEALEKYADEKTWECCHRNFCVYVDSMIADVALREIKELDK